MDPRSSNVTRCERKVLCLEATGRIGGRILTVHDPFCPVPIELGAEFLHGRPPEVWDVIRQAGLLAYERDSRALHLAKGRATGMEEVGEDADRLLAHASSRKEFAGVSRWGQGRTCCDGSLAHFRS